MNLTGRLLAAASLIPRGKTIADIGTDHGYVPVYACMKEICPKAVAADVAPGPLAAAASHVRGAGLTGRIACRLGDGLACIAPGEVDGAVICGMGGSLMQRILTQSPAVWHTLQFAVLQPQSDAGGLRQFLYENQWHVEEEILLIDDGRLYELMRAVPGDAGTLPGWLYEIGPVNWRRKDPLLVRKIHLLMDQKQRILTGWEKSRHDMSAPIRQIQKELQEWEERVCQLQ